MEEYWCVAVPSHNHYPQLAVRGVAVGGRSPRRFQSHQGLGQCCGSPGTHNSTYRKAAAPRSVGGGWYLVSSVGGVPPKPRLHAAYLPSQLNGGATTPCDPTAPEEPAIPGEVAVLLLPRSNARWSLLTDVGEVPWREQVMRLLLPVLSRHSHEGL